MPRVIFTDNIQRHLQCPPCTIPGQTVNDVLSNLFAESATSGPAPISVTARRYVLDDQGALHPHMTVFVDGEPVRDRRTLSDTVHSDSEIYIMQALSGG